MYYNWILNKFYELLLNYYYYYFLNQQDSLNKKTKLLIMFALFFMIFLNESESIGFNLRRKQKPSNTESNRCPDRKKPQNSISRKYGFDKANEEFCNKISNITCSKKTECYDKMRVFFKDVFDDNLSIDRVSFLIRNILIAIEIFSIIIKEMQLKIHLF